jgi:hypothetical protein
VKSILVISGGGPLLILSSYAAVDDPEFAAKLERKGIVKYIAYEVPLERCRDLYGYRYRDIVEELARADDMRVLDFDGHRIFLNFSLRELGPPNIHESASSERAA